MDFSEWCNGDLCDMLSLYGVTSRDLSPETSTLNINADDDILKERTNRGTVSPDSSYWSLVDESSPSVLNDDTARVSYDVPLGDEYENVTFDETVYNVPASTEIPQICQQDVSYSGYVVCTNDNSWREMIDAPIHHFELTTPQSYDSYVTSYPLQNGYMSVSYQDDHSLQSLDQFVPCYKNQHTATMVLQRSTEDDSYDKTKPKCCYMTLIAKAILSTPERRILLSDIYEYIMDKYPFYRNVQSAWRNSIRHNLSVNECFVKDGRALSGRGYYWAIHKACLDDFVEGKFNRRRARQRAQCMYKCLAENRARADVLVCAGAYQCSTETHMDRLLQPTSTPMLS